MQYLQNNSSGVISLAEHLGTRICDHVPETPKKLSEDIVKCMSAIYCKLADPPITNHGIASPTSSLSSMSEFSPKEMVRNLVIPKICCKISGNNIRNNIISWMVVFVYVNSCELDVLL